MGDGGQGARRRRSSTSTRGSPARRRSPTQHVPLRAGSDIAFLGGIVNYILTNEKYFRDYVVAYTNAATILRDDFVDVDDLDGVFSGYDPETGVYDTSVLELRGPGGHAGCRESGTATREARTTVPGRARPPRARAVAATSSGGHGAKLAHAPGASATRRCSTRRACSRC